MTAIDIRTWDRGPHKPVLVEPTFNEFVKSVGGTLVADAVGKNPAFPNADYFFPEYCVVAELKEIQTEFSKSESFHIGLRQLLEKVMKEDPSWRPPLLGGGPPPEWFNREFVRIFRPHLSRVLKKANRQIRETKMYFRTDVPNGTLFFVNDSFKSIEPSLVMGLVSNILTFDYSSIDCVVYLTVNEYVALPDSDIPRLVWWPVYSDRQPEWFPEYINDLGRKWFAFLEGKIGPFSECERESDRPDALLGARYFKETKSHA